MITRTEALKKDSSVYADFDEESQCHGVFGDNTGFCYGLWGDEATAQAHALDMNETIYGDPLGTP